MSDPIEEIKSRIDIVDLVAETVKLKKSGRSYTGFCPFHDNMRTPALAVWPESGTWKCFGVCDSGGDVINWVMRRERMEFREALELLARRAGVELRHVSDEERKVITAERQRSDAVAELLGRAAKFLVRQLWEVEQAAAARDFVRSRALSEEHLKAAQWGFAGSDDALLKAIKAAQGVETAKGVETTPLQLAREIGLVRADGRDFTANANGDKVSPDGWIVYPHVRGGRVVYLSARAVALGTTSHVEGGDKSRNLPGPRQVYRADTSLEGVQLNAPTGLVIVEGPADAESVRAWGWPAWAMCGSPMEDNNGLGQERIGERIVDALRKRAEKETIYAAMSNDAAGARFADKLGEMIGPLVRIVLWPKAEGAKKGDANDWLKAGATPEQVEALLDEAPTYLDEMIKRATVLRDVKASAAAIEHLADLVAKLDETERNIYINDIVGHKDLGIDKSKFERLVNERLPRPEDNGPQYAVVRGRLCHMVYDKLGDRAPAPLFQGNIKIMRDVVEDDGEEQTRLFEMDGWMPDGKQLPRIAVNVDDFASMNWLLKKWGNRAVMTAGGTIKEHLRAAIQLTSGEVEARYDYAHMGWRDIDGKKVYLSASGAVGLENVRVQVGHDLSAYRLPSKPDNVQAAMQASIRMMNVGSSHSTIPLWAAMYLAPLASIVPPAFTIWIYGTTGTLKSTSTALAMCHFGRFAYNTPPASWTATANALERMTYVTKDSPLWIDDFTAQSTFGGNNELKNKSDQLLRNWGNRTGRNRMQADLKLRKTFIPRGLVISTAEILPPNRSILSRLFAVEISPDDLTRGDGSPLSLAQAHDAPLYSHAMAGYLMWLAERYETCESELPDRLRAYTERARSEGKHLRIPGNVAMMFLGFEMGLMYGKAVAALNDDTANGLREIGWATLMEIGDHQAQDVETEDPAEMYIGAIEQMLAQQAIYMRHADKSEFDEWIMPAAMRSKPLGGAEMLGWYDERYWFLLPGAAFSKVCEFYKKAMVVFPDTERGLRKKLLERGVSFPSDQRMVYRLRVGDELHWVLRIVRQGHTIVESGNTENSENNENNTE